MWVVSMMLVWRKQRYVNNLIDHIFVKFNSKNLEKYLDALRTPRGLRLQPIIEDILDKNIN